MGFFLPRASFLSVGEAGCEDGDTQLFHARLLGEALIVGVWALSREVAEMTTSWKSEEGKEDASNGRVRCAYAFCSWLASFGSSLVVNDADRSDDIEGQGVRMYTEGGGDGQGA